MNTYCWTKFRWWPIYTIPYSSAETLLWNSQKSIKKHTKTAIFWPQNYKFSSSAGVFASRPH